MPECLVVGAGHKTIAWQLQLENLGDDWRCIRVQDASAAWELLGQRYWQVLVVCEGEQGQALLTMMQQRPPLSPPWLLTEPACPAADARAELHAAGRIRDMLMCREASGCIPRLALERYRQLVCLARGLMITLNVPRHLRAWDFLPDMLALCTVHPPVAEDLRGRMYPLLARRHGLSVSAVERRLRMAIESTWSGASLAALERFFGHSVDPERGKPTNKEFIFRVQERLLLSARRLA